MKKFLCILLSALTLLLCASCSSKNEVDTGPQVSQMRSICELATMKCYYHTVAKYFEKDVEGSLWWKKDRKFWVEYSGIVTLGIDTSLLKLEIDGDRVIITMPEAQVLGCKVDENSLTEESFIVDKDSADVLAEHQTTAYKEAQIKLEEAAQKDSVLLTSAQDRAKELLENYVKTIGDLMGRTYTITFIGVGEEVPTQTETTEANT